MLEDFPDYSKKERTEEAKFSLGVLLLFKAISF